MDHVERPLAPAVALEAAILRERLDAATVGGGVARLDVVERHDATELAGALERNERRLAQIEAR